MGKPAIREHFDQMEGPRRRRFQPFSLGGSIVTSLDQDALEENGIDLEDLPELDQWIFEEEGKIVIDLDP